MKHPLFDFMVEWLKTIPKDIFMIDGRIRSYSIGFAEEQNARRVGKGEGGQPNRHLQSITTRRFLCGHVFRLLANC